MPAFENLSERLESLEMAEQLAGLGHWRLDVLTGVVGWSKEMFRIHGLAPSDSAPAYKALLSLYLPEDAARLHTAVQQAIAHGKPYSFEGRIKRPDGETRHVSAKARCQLDKDGRCVALFGVSQDVTDLVRSKRATQTLLSQLPALAAYWNPELRCVFANARYVEWFGLTPEKIVGISMRELWGDALFDANLPHVEAVLRGEVRVFERSLSKPAGGFAHMLAQYVPDQDGDGRVHGFFLLITDLTDLKTSQLQLERANAELIDARNVAEAATQAKSEFLSNMSHELRTPLTSIIGFSEVLARGGNLNPAASGHLERIRDASDALLSTINDILDFSKLEAGQIEIERRPIDAADLGRAALALMQPQADAKGLYRLFEDEGVPPMVLGDGVRIRQILLNLLSNAIKFTAAGGVTMRASYDNFAQSLRFEVSDTGIGIPEDRTHRLFQRFSQVDASTSRTFGGTGLGLAICRGLAQAMGGDVGVESHSGEGSTFWFELPCAVAETSFSPATEGDFDIALALQNLRVLIVDDNAANRELAGMICQQFGILATEADGGAAAVLKTKIQPFDVILLDIRMPDVDGPTVAEIIRTKPGPNRSTPIVGFTADFTTAVPAEWAGLFDAWLAKPMVPADLVAILAEFTPESRVYEDTAA